MKSYDFYAITYDGAVFCLECVPSDIDFENRHPIFADSEWDEYPVCDQCGKIHDYVMKLGEE